MVGFLGCDSLVWVLGELRGGCVFAVACVGGFRWCCGWAGVSAGLGWCTMVWIWVLGSCG